jgi:NTE family protein
MRLGVALGGGGARGLAHVGVLLALEEAGLRPWCLAGTSMGAIVGAMYAVAQDLPRWLRVLQHLDLAQMFDFPESYRQIVEHTVRGALVERIRGPDWEEPSPRLERLYELLNLLCKGRRFEDTDIPFAAVAADILRGEKVVIQSGPLYLGVAGSCALPGLFQPVPWEGRLLIDGGAADNLPVNVVADLGAEAVLAVDVSAPGDFLPPETTAGILLRAHTITARQLVRAEIALARERLGARLFLLRPQVDQIRTLEFDRSWDAVAAGRAAAETVLPKLKGLPGPWKAASRRAGSQGQHYSTGRG